MEVTLPMLVNNRKFVRTQITILYNKRLTLSSLNEDDREVKRTQCTTYKDKLTVLDPQIQNLKFSSTFDEDDHYIELTSGDEYDAKLACLFALLRNVAPAGGSNTSTIRSLLRSPIAPLPRYESGEQEDLVKFFREFDETTAKHAYTDYDKLQLLKQQVSGHASTLIQSLESDKQEYLHAKNLLLEALASEELRRFNVIKQLTELKLPYGADTFEYVSKMRLLHENFTKLNIDIEHILQYHFWNGLNESFKNHLTLITNQSRPSLKEIEDNFFKANDRYQSSQKAFQSRKNKQTLVKPSSSKNAVGLAANIKIKPKYVFIPCAICTKETNEDADHPMVKCIKYATAHERIAKLKHLGFCSLCTKMGHTSDSCTYKFYKKCKNCQGNGHFYFLCEKSLGESQNVSSHAVTITEAFQSNLGNAAILPTFTCNIGETKIRALKDGGCQSNFVSQKIAEDFNLKIVQDNIELTVNGINIAQKYFTKLVEADISFGERKFKIKALVLPQIKISLKLENLSLLVQKFVAKGYDLADGYLLNYDNVIDKIDFILGSGSGYCVPESEILFGINSESIYSMTPLGIMLKGNITQILQDLPSLPNLNKLEGLNNISCKGQGNDMNLFGLNNKNSSCLTSSIEVLEAVNVGIDEYKILNEEGLLNESELDRATNTILESRCEQYTNLDSADYNDRTAELNDQLVEFALNNTKRENDGRLNMPLLWNAEVSHLLGKNKLLAQVILNTNLKRLQKNETNLNLMNKVFKDQEKAGIIERIDNLDQFLRDHPEHSFLPHMGVFRPDKDTTKCRVVYLSNLSQKDYNMPRTLSHNQCINSGPCLNQKISSSLLHLRFNSKLLCFDLQKAFNQIALSEVDANKLLCLWYRNIEKGDYTVVGYRNVRLSFGLRCSPTLLMLALYKILIVDTVDNCPKLQNLKKQIYQLSYMDNCALSANSSESLTWAYHQLSDIFSPYKFDLQQFMTNDVELQENIDKTLHEKTPAEVKLLGMKWDRESDLLYTRPISLNMHANTKRSILSSIASQFDIYNFNGPLLNRSRLFLHKLQCDSNLGWDTIISGNVRKEWRTIARQANAAPTLKVKRFVGNRNDPYRLIACSDASSEIYGVTVYIQNLKTNLVNFVLAKNRIVGRELAKKSIPSLETHAMHLAAECLIELNKELTSFSCIDPINIVDMHAYSDSLVSLCWLKSYCQTYDKMQKKAIFVQNRLHSIAKLCEHAPIRFSFVSGSENPADFITRSVSYRRLIKTNYLTGPDFLKYKDNPMHSREDIIHVMVPNPLAKVSDSTQVTQAAVESRQISQHVIALDKYSSFEKLARVNQLVLVFVNKLKVNLKRKHDKYAHVQVKSDDHNFYAESIDYIVRTEQMQKFPEIYLYFSSSKPTVDSMPNLVRQLNVYVDQKGLLRIKSKMEKSKETSVRFPLLLSRDSKLTALIIQSQHVRLSHIGCYSLVSELRKQFWIPKFFQTVKTILQKCVTCKRSSGRTIKLNQSPYREFRLESTIRPYYNIALDHLGPFTVKSSSNENVKIWILCITCMYTRAVNLKLCIDLSTKEFLRALQLHCFDYGIPSYCLSDLGSQLSCGANILSDFLKDHATRSYFEQHGMKPFKYEQFVKGHSQLGSLVEICVKLTKKLIHGAIKTNILSLRDFEFMIAQTVHLINRRPVAFKDALKISSEINLPTPISPEMLIRGYSLPSLNLIPELQTSPSNDDLDWEQNPTGEIRAYYHKLSKVRNNLLSLYHSDYIKTLIGQAVNRKDRYKQVKHNLIKKGDIVLIKEPFSKSVNYPMAMVKDTLINTGGEVTGAVLYKGKTKETVKRHSSNLIPLLSNVEDPVESKDDNIFPTDLVEPRIKRKAAMEATSKNQLVFEYENKI